MGIGDPRLSKPEYRLAALITEELGINIPPAALRMFIRCKWKMVQALAHTIKGIPNENDKDEEPSRSSTEGVGSNWPIGERF